MAKSNRRKRQERQRRQARAAQRSARRERQLAFTAAMRMAEERAERMMAADTAPEDAAELLLETYGADAVPPLGTATALADPTNGDRVRAIRDALNRRSPGSVLARGFELEVARAVDQDPATAGRLVEILAGDVTGAPRAWLAGQCVRLGRLGDAVEFAAAALSEDVDDSRAQGWYAAALAMAAEQSARDGEDDPRAAVALEAFCRGDRLSALSTAVQAWLSDSAVGKDVDAFVGDWLDRLPATVGEVVADDDALAEMAAQQAWLVAGADSDDDDAPIARFAADPATPPDLAALARQWQATVHYGLWQVEDPSEGGPGTWMTDIVSASTRYVALDPARRAMLPRWSVLLGGLVRCDGVWRPAATFVVLTPHEADALTELVLVMGETVLDGMAGRRPKAAARAERPASFANPKPYGVLVCEADPSVPEVRRFLGMVVGSSLPRLIAEIAVHRSATPQLRNTDGDPLCLIRARVAVDDVATVLGRLRAHPDFEVDEDDPAHLRWWGREVGGAEVEMMRAQVAAELGVDPAQLDDPDNPQRWLRGTLRRDRDHLVLEVNSRERLERFLGVLTALGTEPRVVDRSTVDPAQDMALPTGPWGFADGAPQAHEAWQRHWLDERVPALHNRTPRQASQRPDDRPYLEALLRQFEHEADLTTQRGGTGPDIGWLREQLDMPTDDWA